MSKPVLYWWAAAGLAVAVVLLHVGFRWLPQLFPELQKPISEPLQLGPGLTLVLIGHLVLSVSGGVGVGLLIAEGLSIRGQQRWQARWDSEQAEQLRLREIRDQLWLESLPEESRARILEQRRQEQAREQRAQATLAAERQAAHDGRAGEEE